jgi:multidrug resistance efflux pump
MKVSKINGFYAIVALLLGLMLYISATYFSGKGNASVGVAVARDYKINSEKPTLVKSVHAVPGQQVKEGDLLIELISQESDMEIAKLTNQISTLKLELTEKAKLAEADIAYIRAQNGIVTEELEAELKQGRSQLAMNSKLAKEFVSSPVSTEESPIEIKLNSLKERIQRHQQATEIRIKDVRQINNTNQYVLSNQIKLLENELQLLKVAVSKLNKYAIASGVIQQVLVKVGEQISPFTPLMIINPLHPTMVILYSIGQNKGGYSIGTTVSIASYTTPGDKMTGKVIGYGSVTELPEILQKSTAVKAFGQEIFIELPTDNQLANGEKVLVK